MLSSKSIVLLLGELLVFSALLGCQPNVKVDEIPGRYVGTFFNGTEELVLNTDGTYKETFTFNSEYVQRYQVVPIHHNSGNWRTNTTDRDPEVLLENAIIWPVHTSVITASWWKFRVLKEETGSIRLEKRPSEVTTILLKLE
jgi:hypothetical protein